MRSTQIPLNRLVFAFMRKYFSKIVFGMPSVASQNSIAFIIWRKKIMNMMVRYLQMRLVSGPSDSCVARGWSLHGAAVLDELTKRQEYSHRLVLGRIVRCLPNRITYCFFIIRLTCLVAGTATTYTRLVWQKKNKLRRQALSNFPDILGKRCIFFSLLPVYLPPWSDTLWEAIKKSLLIMKGFQEQYH